MWDRFPFFVPLALSRRRSEQPRSGSILQRRIAKCKSGLQVVVRGKPRGGSTKSSLQGPSPVMFSSFLDKSPLLYNRFAVLHIHFFISSYYLGKQLAHTTPAGLPRR